MSAEVRSGDGSTDSLDDKKMTFLEHLMELRLRLIRAIQIYAVAFLLCWWKADRLLGIITRPLAKAWHMANLKDAPELHGALAEPFTVYMRVAMYAALFLASPAIFYQLWAFIAPGLYKRERRLTMSFVTFATALFCSGAVFAYYVALPMAFKYFFTLHTPIPGTDMRIAPMQMVSGYFDTVLQTILIFGISFELPLVLLFLGIVGLVDHKQLWKFGRYFILIAFTVGAIFSPPDVVSQTLVSVPLCLLYFLSIVLVYFFGTKKPVESTALAKTTKKAKAKSAGDSR
jgi:sec-independent protein translocase protein TatC